jgi:hypothetical protein
MGMCVLLLTTTSCFPWRYIASVKQLSLLGVKDPYPSLFLSRFHFSCVYCRFSTQLTDYLALVLFNTPRFYSHSINKRSYSGL